MSAVEHVTDMSVFEDALRERICHWYPDNPRYRRSGSESPHPGDIAYCGHVKTSLPIGAVEALKLPQCEQCLRLAGMGA